MTADIGTPVLHGLEASKAWRTSELADRFTVEEVYGPNGRLRVLGYEWDRAGAMSGALMRNMGVEVIRELVRQCSPDEYPPPLRIAT